MRLRSRAPFGVAAILACLLVPAATHTSGAGQATDGTWTRVDVSKLGPQVGQRVPDFSLKDQSGKTWTLPSIMGPKGAMLVFIRSADW